MASGNTLLVLFPHDSSPPATLYATMDMMVGTSTPVESIPVLDFDDTTVEYADFYCLMPQFYNDGGVSVTFYWSAAAATNNGVWAAAFRRVADDAEDIDTTVQAYDYNTTADLTPPSVVGEVARDALSFTPGTDMDSVTSGDYFILRVKRPAPVGTKITGDVSLHAIMIKEL